MAAIAINDLDLNQELDNSALKSIFGGRWVRRTYYSRYTRRYYRTYRIRRVYYRTVRRYYTKSFTRRYTKWVWV
ncbi:MAG: hypothetical protein CR981_02395 [Proteobacteria bacterium]|nr:MAG: hypothetical protein CR981_02395 [Pseudomonadota bacterium]